MSADMNSMSDASQQRAVHSALIDTGASFPLMVRYWPGTTDTLVVVFSGVGTNPDAYPGIELFRSATENGRNHALFVSDMSRSWLNRPGLDRQIVQSVTDWINRIGAKSVSLVGNSMGGTMALLLADRLPATTVLALAPQFSVSSDIVPEERRWKRYRKNIVHFQYAAVHLRPDQAQIIFIVHGGTPNELMHAKKFPLVTGVRHFIIPRHGHDLAKKLRKRKALEPLVSAAIANRPFKFRRLIERQGGVLMKNYKSEPGDPQQSPK